MDGLKSIQNTFVFVVCGPKEHIETLHFSLRYLRNFSKYEIVVVTDTSRNELHIAHSNIIDVQTPLSYDNHQASIYLKTGIHKFLPKGRSYCYLDSDVLAISSNCDAIFDEFVAPISFARDHNNIAQFSPHAVNCDCIAKRKSENEKLNLTLQKYFLEDETTLELRNQLNQALDTIDSYSSFHKLFIKLKFKYSFRKFWLDNKYYFDKDSETWYHTDHKQVILKDFNTPKFIKEFGLYRDKNSGIWYNDEHQDISKTECVHLLDQIKADFDIAVLNTVWGHWNGGVFLFNDQSHQFLDQWHAKTLATFDLPSWKTRDQGSLVACVWEAGLQHHATLAKKWNFLSNFYNEKIDVKGVNTFTDDDWKTSQEVAFLHVFNHFGDTNWSIWKHVENILDNA